MAKGDFIIIRAKGDDKAVLAECSDLTHQSYSEVVRVALRRYLASLRKGKRG